MAATGQEAVTLEQLKRLQDSYGGGDGGAAIHVFELTASTPSFTFEKSGIGFTRWETDYTIIAVDSEYGVGVLGVIQHDRSTSTVTVATVTGGTAVNRRCYFNDDVSGTGTVTYNGESISLTALVASVCASVSLWIDKA